jgi:transposase
VTGAGAGQNAHKAARACILNEIPAEQVIIACGYTDMRRGIDGLASMVQQAFKLNPCSRALFLFCGRRRDRIKALFWEGDGFVLLYKRLEAGRFQWPQKESEARALTAQQLRWLLEGLSIEQPKALRNVGEKLVV